MKIEIKLDDPKYCDGCPWLNFDFVMCDLTYDFKELCRYEYETAKILRPQSCIDKHGE